MAPRNVRAVDFLGPPPTYELLDGTKYQVAYFDAAGFAAYRAWDAQQSDEALLDAALCYAVPAIDIVDFRRRSQPRDAAVLLYLARGQIDAVLLALKNGASGGAEPEAPPPIDSPA
jgi:hypothetical protein